MVARLLLAAAAAAQPPPHPTPPPRASSTLAPGAPPAPPGYVAIPELSDEFDGDSLDATKWSTDPHVISWPGRAPGLFEPSNVQVAGGKLQLWARPARRNDSWPAGFDNYTTSAVRSLAAVKEGYFEIRWRSGASGISSSWWFHDHDSHGTWTEIDVFETTGTTWSGHPSSPDWCSTTPLKKCRTGCPADPEGTCGPQKTPFQPGQPSCNMCPCNQQNTSCGGGGDSNTMLPSHVHIFALPNTTVPQLPAKCDCMEGTPGHYPCSKPAYHTAQTAFSAGFHTASLNWTAGKVEVGLDGVVVNTISSPCLVEEIKMDFDRETMPGWMELPDPR